MGYVVIESNEYIARWNVLFKGIVFLKLLPI